MKKFQNISKINFINKIDIKVLDKALNIFLNKRLFLFFSIDFYFIDLYA